MKTNQGVHVRWIVALVAASTVAFVIGVRAHDPRLDEADLSLAKAEALLEAAQLGLDNEKQLHEFEKHVARALQGIADARAEIIEAVLVADAP
jgi:hypothetical protein